MMGISTWGFGSCCGAITTWGWGSGPCNLIPDILASFLADPTCYDCVATRSYVEISTRDRSTVLLRIRPDSIPERLLSTILLRAKPDQISERLRCSTT